MTRSFGTIISGNRRPAQELSTDQRAGILAALDAGESKAEVADLYHVNRSTVYDTINRFQQQHNADSRARKGGPRLLGAGDERLLIRIIRKDPKITYNALILESGLDVSRRTIQRLFKRYHITKWLAAKRPLLGPNIARKRLHFATSMASFDWKKILFSDECSYIPGSGRQRCWVFRYTWEKWFKEMIDEVPKSGRPKSYMIWAAIGYDTRSELIFMNRYGATNGYTSESYQEALEEGLLPIYKPGHPFQQDNAPIHMSRATKDFFESHGIWVIDWPPYTPDLNPIEHVWWELKKQILLKYPELSTLGQSEGAIARLKVVAEECWQEIDQDFFRRLFDSMPRRLAAVRAAKGWHTRY